MKVNVAVCGRFHFGKYIRHVAAAGCLNRFYYSAALGKVEKHLGGPVEEARNLFAKEYLVFGHRKLFKGRGEAKAFHLYESLWQQSVLNRWSKADLLHFMLHGNCDRIVRRARRDGSVVIGEPVNSHPSFFRNLINEEHDRLKIGGAGPMNPREQSMADEGMSADYLLAGSSFIKRSYVAQGYAPERIHVIRYGGDSAVFFPESSPKTDNNRPFRVICVAQVAPRKGHVDLLEAWKRLSLPNAELLFIGACLPEMVPVLARYQGLFRHIPHVPNHELRRYYTESDLFVLPSIEDGFALVCAEAAACGLPVITTENTGAAEIFTDGLNGFVLPIRSPDAIAEKIEVLYRDPDRRNAMGQAALHSIRTQGTWTQYVDQLVAFYRQVASGTAMN